ncbi:MAG: ElyC/SanA/YdcF family protein [Acidobacteriota bacterium]
MSVQIWRNLENLILVAGHAIYISENSDNPQADSNWILQPFQTGEPPFYIEHIQCGVELASRDAQALLVFSGGQTRHEAHTKSEAESYLRLAEHFNWWEKVDLKGRATTEEYARDSFENLLFSICRFRQCVGKYPQHITIISWAFKARRFELHREAIGFPLSQFTFIGANNPVDLASAEQNEQSVTAAFSTDPYGYGESKENNLLGDKRRARNPFNRAHPYAETCPELAGLLTHRKTGLYAGELPWSAQKSLQT